MYFPTWQRSKLKSVRKSSHVDLNDPAPSLKAIIHDKKSASVRQADVLTILTRFNPDKKSAVLQQKIG